MSGMDQEEQPNYGWINSMPAVLTPLLSALIRNWVYGFSVASIGSIGTKPGSSMLIATTQCQHGFVKLLNHPIMEDGSSSSSTDIVVMSGSMTSIAHTLTSLRLC